VAISAASVSETSEQTRNYTKHERKIQHDVQSSGRAEVATCHPFAVSYHQQYQ